MTKKAWGGRFQGEALEWVDAFNASIHFDKVLIEKDITGSIAHATMLAAQGIITGEERDQIIEGLKAVLDDYDAGRLEFSVQHEDIHMNVEHALISKIGEVGGKLHTARSRNDQIATDMHLYIKEKAYEIIESIETLQYTILNLAKENIHVVMPGYTHLQRAQPVLFSHHIMAYFWMLKRDKDRFNDSLARIDLSPLGAGAISGTTFDIDREQTQELLGFSDIYQNSMDAVSDRDYIIETLSNISLVMVHLSRLSEEIIFWMSEEANFVQLSDQFTTGSSMMPQKKNPDMAELIRGKSARTTGALTSMLMLVKGLPLTYNKDLQEDKEGVFDAVTTVTGSLRIMTGMLETMTINEDVLEQTVEKDFSNATELADYLVEKGVPFRKAHEVVGELVLKCINDSKYLKDLSLAEFQAHHPSIDEDIYTVLTPKVVVDRRKSLGGTGTEAVEKQLSAAEATLSI
ncbi:MULTISPECIES: argininosuccinate lyase [Salinicoccus]|uniref:Argininosuccinate lyase n=1 Tax=Salinicoccus roseus TaxID=45670 RepID=A0A0C2E9F9_9STAP|nr:MULTISPECIES: argininosuccinate lyase [Salinicoccus]KIH71882.1 argininosuccinate lyase [Salinicoccus roseus]MCC4721779.1 argininosuccinate lyase [Salinicoccus sp. RF5]MDB0579015.1 argininosuccinate lyase [Salinicoccus roseus]